MKKNILIENAHLLPFIYEGYVMDADDPQQEGRLKVWIPAIDGENYSINHLVWTQYASPFGGITHDFPAGRNKKVSEGPVAYGFWAIPKINAQVLCFFLNGEVNRRFWFASFFDYQRNRSLPAGRNSSSDGLKGGPLTDIEMPLEPAYSNQKAAGLGSDSFERAVAQPKTEKDGADGYAPNPADPSYKDSQTYCWTTPGHHTIIMSDVDSHCRIRIKSCEGNQVLLDDSTGRVYISTALGNTWLELNEDGNIYLYGGKSISIRAQEDVNITANGNINLAAGGAMNIISGTSTNIQAGGNINLSSNGSTALSSCGNIDLTAQIAIRLSAVDKIGLTGTAGILQTGAEIHLNGLAPPLPECAAGAGRPSIIPTHEPFTRG